MNIPQFQTAEFERLLKRAAGGKDSFITALRRPLPL